MRPADSNPFRTSMLERLDFRFPPGWSVDRVLARMEALGGRGAIVGPRGSGKTALLALLGAELRRRGWRVIESGPRGGRWERSGELGDLLAGAGAGDAILLDIAGMRGRRHWRGVRSATRRAGILVITAHRRGRLPVLHRPRSSVDTLAWIVARVAPELFDELAPRLPAIFRRQGGNLHTALLELYDLAAAGGPLS